MRVGSVVRTNGVLLLLTLPFFARLWVEAVAWRIDRGPQLIGFSLAHGGAGVLTVPLLISLLCTLVYWLFVAAVAGLWLVPSIRARMDGTLLVLAGGIGTVGFQAVAAFMQADLPRGVLYGSAVVLAAVFVFLVVVTVASFCRKGLLERA